MTARYGKTMANCGQMSIPMESVSPKISAPNKAPHIFPRPPIMTMRKVSIMSVWSMP